MRHLLFTLALALALAGCGGAATAGDPLPGGPTGPTGPSGPTGSTGPTGPAASLRCAGTAPALPDRLAVGYSGSLATAAGGGFDVRYMYLAGELAPGADCLADGRAKAAGCGTSWWGTWQYDQLPSGQYVGNFAAETAGAGMRPMITYYLLLPAARALLGIGEGPPEVTTAATNQAFMKAYLDDFRFFLKKLGAAPAIVHVEPDFWGYAQQRARAVGTDAHGLLARVASAKSSKIHTCPAWGCAREISLMSVTFSSTSRSASRFDCRRRMTARVRRPSWRKRMGTGMLKGRLTARVISARSVRV